MARMKAPLIDTVRAWLASPCNLRMLSRDSGVDLRTLRRIKNGQTKDVMLTTVERIESARKLQS